MEKQFVDLFDQKKSGFNFFAAIGLFLGGVIGWFLWLLGNVILYRGAPFAFDIEQLGRSVLTNLVFAFVFVGLCHIIKKDIFLPFAAGLAQIILGILYKSTGLYEGQIFNFQSILISFLWSFFLAGGLILFFRIMGLKPLAFLLGFAASALLMVLIQLVVYSTPMSFFMRWLLIQIAEALITGFLFYMGLSIHFKKQGIPLERERVMVSQVTPIVAAGEPGVSPAGVVASGKFRKVAVRPITVKGRYRGKGIMQIDEQGIKIFGRHVFSLGARWGIALGIFFGSLIITMAMTGGAGYFAPGLIPLYFLMEYGILKRENISIPYSALKGYAADPRGNLIAVTFEGSTLCTPAVLRTENWREVLRTLREKVPQLDANPGIAVD